MANHKKIREQTEAAAVWEPLEKLAPWAMNPRVNDRAVPGVAASIIRFGWGNPFLALEDTGELIAGHTRLKAVLWIVEQWSSATDAKREEWRNTLDRSKRWHPETIQIAENKRVPVRYRSDLPPEEAHLLAVADNKTGEQAEWDENALAQVLSDYSLVDAKASGFDLKELDRLLESPSEDALLSGAPQLNGDLRYQVIVDCASEGEQSEMLQRFREQGLKVRALVV